MKRNKLNIPMPDESIIAEQISQIVSHGLVKKETFPSYLCSIVQQVGWRHLFSDRLELSCIISIVIGLYGLFFATPYRGDVQDLYAYVFLLSPVLFLAFSIFSYMNKTQNGTYDVEMACKYNVYQVTAFRMLAFSATTMVLNTGAIALLAMKYEEIHFLRAFLLSGTSLFLFSFILSLALIKRRTKGIVTVTIAMWMLGNVMLESSNHEFYIGLLLQIPRLVYAVVLFGFLMIYISYLKKLIDFKQSEGVF